MALPRVCLLYRLTEPANRLREPRPWRSRPQESTVSALAPVVPLRPMSTTPDARRPDRPTRRQPIRPVPAPAIEQLELPFEWEVAPGVPAVPPAPAHLRVVGADEAAESESSGAPKAAWVARMALAIYEVGSGQRPAGQLTRWVKAEALSRLEARGRAASRHPSTRVARPAAATPQKHAVRGIRVCAVAPSVYETSAVVVGARGTAIAMRLERVAEQWLVTELSLG